MPLFSPINFPFTIMSHLTRRQFSSLAISVLPLGLARPSFAADKPNSKVNGVQIGLNVPYSFGNVGMTGEETLKACIQVGVSAVELRTQPVEAFLGAPMPAPKGSKAPKDPDAGKKLREWRESADAGRAAEFRKIWEDAGVLIDVVKVDGLFKMSDGELNYAFKLAKTLGARAISTEISKVDEELKRVGGFADKHEFLVCYHGHAATGPEEWEKAFSFAKFNGANVDIGHFVAGDHGSPVPFITKYHDRISHVHIKDRKTHNGGNTPFGEGETPIKDVLRLIRDNKWNIQATIEFEYKVPEGSDRLTEIAKSVKYCREALA